MDTLSVRSSSPVPAGRAASNAPSRSSRSKRWINIGLWLSYLAAIALMVATLVPGGWGDSNSHSWKPTRGLPVFSVRAQADPNTQDVKAGSPGQMYQVVFMLSSTCLTPETTLHGGVPCSSNIGEKWTVERLRSVEGYPGKDSFSQAVTRDADISTPAICSLVIVAIVLSTLILLVRFLARHIKIGVVAKREWQASILQTILGLVAFVLVLAGAILTRVEVSKVLSILRESENAKDPRIHNTSEANSVSFWACMGVAVALMGCNLLVLIFTTVKDGKKQYRLIGPH